MTFPVTIDWVSGEGFVARDAAGSVGRGTTPHLALAALDTVVRPPYQPLPPAAAVWEAWPVAGAHSLDDVAARWQPTEQEYRDYWAAVEEHRRQRDQEGGGERSDTSDAA
jgi:hypothetical protein